MTVKRWKSAGITLASLLVLLSGCTPAVSGVDKDLADDWSALPEAKIFAPSAAACHPQRWSDTGPATDYRPIDCAEAHYGETVYVGQFTGAAGSASSPPDVNTGVVTAAYAECDKQATGYVGREWRDGRLSLDLTVPSTTAWTGGARWFRCDLNELTTVTETPAWAQRKGSLKGALPPDLLLGCFNDVSTGGTVDKMPELFCTTSHNAEYVGIFTAPISKAYPKADAEWEYFYDQCRNVIAQYVGVTRSTAGKYGVIAWPDKRWAGGDRGVRCYIWLDKKSVSKSVKDSGGAGVPTA
jgi:hypothetical protein